MQKFEYISYERRISTYKTVSIDVKKDSLTIKTKRTFVIKAQHQLIFQKLILLIGLSFLYSKCNSCSYGNSDLLRFSTIIR